MGCSDKEIRKSEFVAKAQLLYLYNSSEFLKNFKHENKKHIPIKKREILCL